MVRKEAINHRTILNGAAVLHPFSSVSLCVSQSVSVSVSGRLSHRKNKSETVDG
jgi:hypothetical protein